VPINRTQIPQALANLGDLFVSAGDEEFATVESMNLVSELMSGFELFLDEAAEWGLPGRLLVDPSIPEFGWRLPQLSDQAWVDLRGLIKDPMIFDLVRKVGRFESDVVPILFENNVRELNRFITWMASGEGLTFTEEESANFGDVRTDNRRTERATATASAFLITIFCFWVALYVRILSQEAEASQDGSAELDVVIPALTRPAQITDNWALDEMTTLIEELAEHSRQFSDPDTTVLSDAEFRKLDGSIGALTLLGRSRSENTVAMASLIADVYAVIDLYRTRGTETEESVLADVQFLGAPDEVEASNHARSMLKSVLIDSIKEGIDKGIPELKEDIAERTRTAVAGAAGTAVELAKRGAKSVTWSGVVGTATYAAHIGEWLGSTRSVGGLTGSLAVLAVRIAVAMFRARASKTRT
jgi:hypothetical protein